MPTTTRIIDIYRTPIHLAYGTKATRKILKRYKLDAPSPGAAATTYATTNTTTGELHIIITLSKYLRTAPTWDWVNVLAHEATHAAAAILTHINAPQDGEEPHAYLIGWLTQWLWEHSTDHRKTPT